MLPVTMLGCLFCRCLSRWELSMQGEWLQLYILMACFYRTSVRVCLHYNTLEYTTLIKMLMAIC